MLEVLGEIDKNPRIHVDMDGVLADLGSGINYRQTLREIQR